MRREFGKAITELAEKSKRITPRIWSRNRRALGAGKELKSSD